MLHVDRQDGIATLTLDRPAVGNALDDALVARLGEALAACAADPAVRVVVVTGAGKVFSAGADLKDRKSTRLNSSHGYISYAVFCLKKKKKKTRSAILITRIILA